MFRFFQGFKLVVVLLVASNITACSTHEKEFEPNKDRKFFGVAVRQLAPEPVYNRLRLVYLPEPMPSRNIQSASYARIAPVFQFEMKGASLEQVARVLASLARYTSYTSSVIADKKITVVAVGTIDELAQVVSEKAGINVMVDHENREVRFLANGMPEPRRNVSARQEQPAVPADTSLGDVKVSEKTNGYLNKIKIEG